jgi:hypothetical protein
MFAKGTLNSLLIFLQHNQFKNIAKEMGEMKFPLFLGNKIEAPDASYYFTSMEF